MEFMNREKEIALLEEYFSYSKKTLFPVFVYGIRRVGKTRLVRRFSRDKKSIYFMVNAQKNSNVLLEEFDLELREKLQLPDYIKFENWESFFSFLIDSEKLDVIIFDEFQNFLKVDKSIYGTLQKVIDLKEEKCKMLVFTGSAIGLIKKVFEDEKEPLYGRAKGRLQLRQLKFSECRKMLKKLEITDVSQAVRFYSVFGGIPKYYVLAQNYEAGAKNLEDILELFFFRENALLEKEVLDILSLELGTKKSMHYSICEAVATGHTKLNEIATYVGTQSTGVSPFLDELINRYELIERRDPITRMDSKEGIYLLKNNIFQFWFRFIHPRQSLYEIGDYEAMKKIVYDGLNPFVGRGFEQICRDWALDLNLQNKLPFRFQEIGNWWHKDKEIDMIAINEKEKSILFGEVKWSDNVDAEAVLNKLYEKKEFVQWHNNSRLEHFVIFAKSFKKKTDEALLFDIKDLEKIK